MSHGFVRYGGESVVKLLVALDLAIGACPCIGVRLEEWGTILRSRRGGPQFSS